MAKKDWWDAIPAEAQILINLALVYVDASNYLDDILSNQNLVRFVANGHSVDKQCQRVSNAHSELRIAVAEFKSKEER